MTLPEPQKKQIGDYLVTVVRQKLKGYSRNTKTMPFLDRLVSDPAVVASFSFIQSMNTSLGQSIFEKISETIAAPHFDQVETQYHVGGTLNDGQNAVIRRIVGELRTGARKVNKIQEIKEILSISPSSGRHEKHNDIADVYLRKGSKEWLFDIKTVKPNIGNFGDFKAKLLEWVARKRISCHTMLALPYNPYGDEPYSWFTQSGFIDPKEEIMIGREYWDFLGGTGTYDELLQIFEDSGMLVRADLKAFFDKLRSGK